MGTTRGAGTKERWEQEAGTEGEMGTTGGAGTEGGAGAGSPDYYASYPRREDNGYLAELVETCRMSLATLPAYAAAAPRRAAERIVEFQSSNLSRSQGEHDAFERWAREAPVKVEGDVDVEAEGNVEVEVEGDVDVEAEVEVKAEMEVRRRGPALVGDGGRRRLATRASTH